MLLCHDDAAFHPGIQFDEEAQVRRFACIYSVTIEKLQNYNCSEAQSFIVRGDVLP